MLTNTWRKRLDGTSTLVRRGALAVGLTSCSIVAIATTWGWIFNDPIDVAGPARSAVNRTALIGSYAQDCVTRWLTATAAHQQSLHDCWSLRDQMRLPTTPAVIVSSPAVSAVTLVDDTGAAQQWSVVVTVSERPFEAATPHDVLRNAGTEAPYSSPLNDEHRRGVFSCAGCALHLYSSDTKFDSGTGWPSFWKALDNSLLERRDTSLGMIRTEVLCSRCGGHLGHVFNDGPQPTGLRYCMNGVAMTFEAL